MWSRSRMVARARGRARMTYGAPATSASDVAASIVEVEIYMANSRRSHLLPGSSPPRPPKIG
jgi:hypothetical protein